MPVRVVAFGVSESFDAVEAFTDAAARRRRAGWTVSRATCVWCSPALPISATASGSSSAVHDASESPASDRLRRRGRGRMRAGRSRRARRRSSGPPSMPEAEIATHHFETEQTIDGLRRRGRARAGGGRRRADRARRPVQLRHRGAARAASASCAPGCRCSGGLASAAAAGSASLFRDGEVLDGGAVGLLARGRAAAAVRLAGRRAGRARDDDHGCRGQRDRGAGLEAGDRAPARGARPASTPASRSSRRPD